MLFRRHGLSAVVLIDKRNATARAARQVLDWLLPQRDLVVTAVGDRGSCSSSSLRDGINIEQRGLPAAVICTRPFIPTARAMARNCSLPDYPFAVIDHPIGSLTDAELRRRAEAALPQVVAILEQALQSEA